MKQARRILGVLLLTQIGLASTSIYTNSNIMEDADVRFVIVKDNQIYDNISRGTIDQGLSAITTPSDFEEGVTSGTSATITTEGLATLTPESSRLGKAELKMVPQVNVNEGDTGVVTLTSNRPLDVDIELMCIITNDTTAKDGSDIVNVAGVPSPIDGNQFLFFLRKGEVIASFDVVTKEDVVLEPDEILGFDCEVKNGLLWELENDVSKLMLPTSNVVIINDDLAYPATKTQEKIETSYWWCDSCNYRTGIKSAMLPIVQQAGGTSIFETGTETILSSLGWLTLRLTAYVYSIDATNPIYVRSGSRGPITINPGDGYKAGGQRYWNYANQLVAGDADKPTLYFWTFKDTYVCEPGHTLFLSGETWMCRL